MLFAISTNEELTIETQTSEFLSCVMKYREGILKLQRGCQSSNKKATYWIDFTYRRMLKICYLMLLYLARRALIFLRQFMVLVINFSCFVVAV